MTPLVSHSMQPHGFLCGPFQPGRLFMKLQELCRRAPLTVLPDAYLAQAVAKMWEGHLKGEALEPATA